MSQKILSIAKTHGNAHGAMTKQITFTEEELINYTDDILRRACVASQQMLNFSGISSPFQQSAYI